MQQLHRERAARAREREVSSALQRSLLPNLPELPGITCAARYLVGALPAQVGGDWYDLFALPDGAIGLAIGDVMGHDLAAAAAMGQLRSVLRSYAHEGSSPSVVLDRLDRLLQDFEMAQLATAIYGRLVLDNGSAMLMFTNAGHLPPLKRCPDGTVSQLRRGAAPLIGAVPPGRARRGETVVALPPGSHLGRCLGHHHRGSRISLVDGNRGWRSRGRHPRSTRGGGRKAATSGGPTRLGGPV